MHCQKEIKKIIANKGYYVIQIKGESGKYIRRYKADV